MIRIPALNRMPSSISACQRNGGRAGRRPAACVCKAVGACPGCTNLADGLDATTPLDLNQRDVTMICFSRAPIDRLTAYKERMGWGFPYVSTYETAFPRDFGLALTREQAEQIPEVRQMVENPPDWLLVWASQVGADLKDGIRENPSYIAFAKQNGTV